MLEVKPLKTHCGRTEVAKMATKPLLVPLCKQLLSGCTINVHPSNYHQQMAYCFTV